MASSFVRDVRGPFHMDSIDEIKVIDNCTPLVEDKLTQDDHSETNFTLESSNACLFSLFEDFEVELESPAKRFKFNY